MAGAPRGNKNAVRPGNPGFTVTIRVTKAMRIRLEKQLGREATEEELKASVKERIEKMLDTDYTEMVERVYQSLPEHLQQQIIDELEEKYGRGDLSRPDTQEEQARQLVPILCQYRDIPDLLEE